MLRRERKFLEGLLVAFSPCCFKENVSEFLFSSAFFFSILLAIPQQGFISCVFFSKDFYLSLFLFLDGFTSSLMILGGYLRNFD